jgi:hypothetical protein
MGVYRAGPRFLNAPVSTVEKALAEDGFRGSRKAEERRERA